MQSPVSAFSDRPWLNMEPMSPCRTMQGKSPPRAPSATDTPCAPGTWWWWRPACRWLPRWWSSPNSWRSEWPVGSLRPKSGWSSWCLASRRTLELSLRPVVHGIPRCLLIFFSSSIPSPLGQRWCWRCHLCRGKMIFKQTKSAGQAS